MYHLFRLFIVFPSGIIRVLLMWTHMLEVNLVKNFWIESMLPVVRLVKLFHRICRSQQSVKLIFIKILRIENVVDDLLVRISMNCKKIQILLDTILVNWCQFFVLFWEDVLLQIACQRKQFCLYRYLLILSYYEIWLSIMASTPSIDSPLNELFFWL